MKNISNKNKYKFKLFRGRPVPSIIALVVIFASCYFVGTGRIMGGQVRMSTPTSINASFRYFYGRINKTFILPPGTYSINISDQLSCGDLHYSLLLDGEEILSTYDPVDFPIDGEKGKYSIVVRAREWTQGSFAVEAVPSNTNTLTTQEL